VVALFIAVSKAILIVLFFMQVRYSSREILIFSCAAYLWVAIMLIGTLQRLRHTQLDSGRVSARSGDSRASATVSCFNDFE